MILGVDPGADGALALLADDGSLVDARDMPTVEVASRGRVKQRVSPQAVAAIVREHAVLHAFVERVGSMPNQGVASSFTFGYAAGCIEGVLAGLGVPVTFVAPRTWKRAFKLSAEKGEARQRAMQCFPEHAGKFARVKDDGRAEAALIALWGRRNLMPMVAAA
jgi:crossover junction endodeoxyribonuclease RuvC